MLITIISTGVLCLVFWGMCYLGTGGDEKNIKNYACYPNEAQVFAKQNEKLAGKIKNDNLLVEPNPVKTFLSNFILFGIVLFIIGIFVRSDSFAINFIRLSIIGQGLNLFDYIVIDLLWWRNTKRIRFSGTEDKPELYRNPKKHTQSFIKGILLFLIIAVCDGLILMLL